MAIVFGSPEANELARRDREIMAARDEIIQQHGSQAMFFEAIEFAEAAVDSEVSFYVSLSLDDDVDEDDLQYAKDEMNHAREVLAELRAKQKAAGW